MDINLLELSAALADRQLIPHFQPIVELRTGKISGFEVLTRWDHPIHGAFLPGNLIQLAENNGLIQEVADQVFSQAFSLVAAMSEPLRLSVNLSPVQFGYDGLARQIEEMAALAGLPLDRLTIEITESAILSDLARADLVAHELKELGCRLSLDDFGTGYSSLAHLQALPFDELKIDRSFVTNMTTSRRSRKIIASIIGLGHSIGLNTVAEGVETEKKADMLFWLGAEHGQGWHYGRPSPFHAIRTMVTAAPRPVAARIAGPGKDWAIHSFEAFPTQRLAQLQAIYDGAPVGLCFLDCNLRYISINQRLADMNGESIDVHLRSSVQEILGDFYPTVEPFFTRALQGEATLNVEMQRPRRDRDDIGWVMTNFQPAFDEADEVIGISLSVMDITDHKKAQLELKESEALKQQLIELSQQVPWAMDADGSHLQIGSEWKEDGGDNSRETQNLSWSDALHPEDLTPAIQTIQSALSTGKQIDMECRIQSPNGEWRWKRSRALARFGASGEITRWHGNIEDIHERKCAENEARKAANVMRALLKSVPVAVVIGEGGRRLVHQNDSAPPEQVGFLDWVPTAFGMEAVAPVQAERLPSGVQELAPKKLPTSLAFVGPSIGRLARRRRGFPKGLRFVDDLDFAQSERQRLSAMLEEFATHHINSR
jgi:PAS domain S-box-containing protein